MLDLQIPLPKTSPPEQHSNLDDDHKQTNPTLHNPLKSKQQTRNKQVRALSSFDFDLRRQDYQNR